VLGRTARSKRKEAARQRAGQIGAFKVPEKTVAKMRLSTPTLEAIESAKLEVVEKKQRKAAAARKKKSSKFR
jgi:hypothetical protein